MDLYVKSYGVREWGPLVAQEPVTPLKQRRRMFVTTADNHLNIKTSLGKDLLEGTWVLDLVTIHHTLQSSG